MGISWGSIFHEFLNQSHARGDTNGNPRADNTSDQKQRWVASALSFIEPRLRRINGYRHLPQLRAALQAKSGKAERGEGTHIA